MDLRRIFFLLGIVFVCTGAFAAPWDFLRDPAAGLTVVDPITSWIVFLVSLGVFIVAFLALRKRASPRLSWVFAAFGLFLLKRLLIVIDIYVSPGEFMNNAIQGFFDLLIILCFFVALFRK